MVKKCIASVYTQNINFMEIILIDNSDKEGIDPVLKKYPKVRYIKSKTNLGFGKAVNVGLSHAKGKFSLILTPDTTLLPTTIEKTLLFIQKSPQVALVGCKIFSYPHEFHLSAGKNYPNIFSHLFEYNVLFYKICKYINPNSHPLFYSKEEHQQILYTKHIIGAYMLFRMKAIIPLGFFDTNFRMYREETDLCWRLRENNWEIAYLPVGGLIHYGGTEWKKTKISQALPNYLESTYRFFAKHYGKTYTILAWIAGIVSAGISIPYLFLVSMTKILVGKPSQSTQLLPDWIYIFNWHLQNSNMIFSL